MGGGASIPDQVEHEEVSPRGQGDGVDDSTHLSISVIKVVGGGTLALCMVIGVGGVVAICWAKAKFLAHGRVTRRLEEGHSQLQMSAEQLKAALMHPSGAMGPQFASPSLAQMPSQGVGGMSYPKMTYGGNLGFAQNPPHQNLTPTGYAYRPGQGLAAINQPGTLADVYQQLQQQQAASDLVSLKELLQRSSQGSRIHEVKNSKKLASGRNYLGAIPRRAAGAAALAEKPLPNGPAGPENGGQDQLSPEELEVREKLQRLSLCDSPLNRALL